MDKRTKKRVLFPLTGAFAIFVVLVQLNVSTKLRRLRERGKLTTAFVTGSNHRPKSGRSVNIRFEYMVEGQRHAETGIVNGIPSFDFSQHFKGRTFRLIYDPVDLKNVRILITPEDFESIGRNLPDSLNWVLNFWED